MDFSKIVVEPLSTSLNKSNIVITKNYGLDGSSGFWCLKFTFDYKLEKAIAVGLTNFKYDSTGKIWTLEIEKCHYLRIKNADDRVSFDMEDELVNVNELKRLRGCAFNNEKLQAKDKPLMRTFKAGLKFLGYSTWIDKSDMPIVAHLPSALKISIDDCDCLIAWLNEEYFKSEYCTAELLYAKNLGKMILPFGVFSKIKTRLREDENLKFLEGLLISNPNEMSFFEVLRRIDETLFNFEDGFCFILDSFKQHPASIYRIVVTIG
ncbi:TIR domain-containing [Paramuricea clavata]|uniref:TIR domain-containing n=1 Tax=Paramuricea clavata TaxID=317549 RepID=A0A7D9IWU6_PARCT|nr:TIR domain-containing [Paramuricea clavata]